MSGSSQPSSDDRSLVQAGFRFALSLTHHPEEAEDIVQQACFKVIRKKGRLHSRSYLLKAVRNLFYDSERRRKLVPFESMDAAQARMPVQPTVFGVKDHDVGFQIDLESELDRLASEEREVLFLNCVEGYTTAELAAMLDKPRSTVLNILSRAKAKLAKAREREDRNHG